MCISFCFTLIPGTFVSCHVSNSWNRTKWIHKIWTSCVWPAVTLGGKGCQSQPCRCRWELLSCPQAGSMAPCAHFLICRQGLVLLAFPNSDSQLLKLVRGDSFLLQGFAAASCEMQNASVSFHSALKRWIPAEGWADILEVKMCSAVFLSWRFAEWSTQSLSSALKN